MISGSFYAQKFKVTYDDDTIKVDGKPYAIMKKQNIGPMRNDYAVSSLSNIELVYFKTELNRYSPYRSWMFGSNPFMYGNDELYYKAVFINTGSEANLRHQSAKGFAKLVVESNLIKDNAIDPISEKRFILLNNGTTPSIEKPNNEPSASSPALVVNINNNVGNTGSTSSTTSSTLTATTVAKSKSPVVINGNQITRDGLVIGKYRQDTTSSAYVQKTVVLTIYSEGGEKIAEATAPITKPQEWVIKLLNENKTLNVMYDAPNEKEKLFKWLADKNYLTN